MLTPTTRDRVPVWKPVARGVALLLCGLVGCEESSGTTTPSGEQNARADMRAIRAAAESYRGTYGECPSEILDLVIEGMLDDAPGVDPWGQEYRVVCERAQASVRSAGPDGAWDSADDLSAP